MRFCRAGGEFSQDEMHAATLYQRAGEELLVQLRQPIRI